MAGISLQGILSNKLSYFHSLVAICLGVFFIYAGVKKFIPKPAPKTPINNEVFIQSMQTDVFETPITFKLTMKMLRTSGFLKLIGALQIASGLLILFPVTRLVGLLMLLPVAINIFSFHFFMDNRVEENIETGTYLLINVLLLLYYIKPLMGLFIVKPTLTQQSS
jgi:uncharacterized membrane protein YphA (DoxX/SURF4 family)